MNNPRPRTSAPPEGSETWLKPWVQLRTGIFHPHIYRDMICTASEDARAGDMVAVYDKIGSRFGSGFYNPQSKISLRMVHFSDKPVDAEFFRKLLVSAVSLRHDTLRLPEKSNAYRVFNSEGDGLSGLIVDRYDDVLSVQVLSQGIYQKLGEWLPILHELVGTKRHHVRMEPQIVRLEGFEPSGEFADSSIRSVRVQESGVRYAVNFETGHKTGFFCDQRENRLLFAEMVRDKTVLDLCCYTGGFAITAKVLGGAGEITGVDLDEDSIEQAKHNANLNQVKIRWVHQDAYIYARQMKSNGKQWDVVVIDPPKFVPSKIEFEDGRKKYRDLNQLAISLLVPGGLLVTCSCSGLMSEVEFEKAVVESSSRLGRRLQFIKKTGAGPDHPILSNFPESHYLKVLWARAI